MNAASPAIPEGQELVTREFAQLTPAQLDLIKQTIAKDATDDELAMFGQLCDTTGLNPFAKEIFFWKVKGKAVMPVAVKGLRRKAADSGHYMGQVGPFWCGDDGIWKDVWLSEKYPTAAKVGVYRRGNPEPTWAVVKWSEFAKDTTTPAGRFWRDMPAHMLGNAAERHALRKAVPGVVEKLEAVGVRVMDADYLIAQAEHIERQRALPQHTPPGDLGQELFGTKQEPRVEPAPWSQEDWVQLRDAVAARELASTEWRALLGLPATAEGKEVRVLGTVQQVVALLEIAFAKALAGEPVEQAQLGF